jgi:group I intron endonuclease
MKDNKNKSGIYRWTNRITGKFYIGSAVNLTKRLRFYYSSKSIENSLLIKRSYIYTSILKYGYSKFSLEIIEYCDLSILLQREQYYLDTLKPEYNIRKKVGIIIR